MFYIKQIPFIFKISAFLILFFIAFPLLIAHSADVVLSWDRPNDDRVTGYKIFYGLADTDFKSTVQQSINTPAQTSCNIFSLISGQTYGFAAKSIDDKGNESIFSEVIFYDVPETQDGKSNDDDDSADNIDGNSNNANNNAVDNTGNIAEDNDSVASGSGGGGGCFIQTVSNVNILN